jgi:hypothetical protein
MNQALFFDCSLWVLSEQNCVARIFWEDHPCLVEIAQRHPEVLVTGNADETFFRGPQQVVTKATPDFKVILQVANLQLNTSESNLHIPQLATQEMSALAARAFLFHSGSHDEFLYHLKGVDNIPLENSWLSSRHRRILHHPPGFIVLRNRT